MASSTPSSLAGRCGQCEYWLAELAVTLPNGIAWTSCIKLHGLFRPHTFGCTEFRAAPTPEEHEHGDWRGD